MRLYDALTLLGKTKKEVKALQKKLDLAVEALISIAFFDEPLADTIEYWLEWGNKDKFEETLMNDTDIARQALSEIEKLGE